MFRTRKDEENTMTDQEQTSLLGGGSESANVLPPQASGYGSQAPAPASAQTGFSGNGTYQMSAPPPRNEGPQAPAARPHSPAAQQPAPFRATQQPEPRRVSEPAKGASSFAATGALGGGKDSRRVLTVGADILLKGEIATCDRLVIEGKVDAVLNDVGTVELAETGSFKGTANVENAEISGLFDGELTVKGRLIIYASGKVRGKVTYGEIEIERGGEISGEIKTINSQGRPGVKSPATKDDKVAA